MIRTVLIYPEENKRKMISSHLSSQGEIIIIGTGKDAYDALKISGDLKPDIVIFGDNLIFLDGSEILPLLRIRSPLTSAILLTEVLDNIQIINAVISDVAGYACMKTDFEILPEIIKCVYSGKYYISPEFADRFIQIISFEGNYWQKGSSYAPFPFKFPQIKHKIREKFPFSEDPSSFLNKTELHILSCLGEAYTNDEIAGELKLSSGTVRNYISILIQKTGLQTRLQLVRYAIDYGLFPT